MGYLNSAGLSRFYAGLKNRFLLKANVVNNLTTTAEGGVLDARQGAEIIRRTPVRNLLDNSYFPSAYVINQRGQTSYTATGYTIDRWQMFKYSSEMAVSPTENGLSITYGTHASDKFVQLLPSPEAYYGKAYTVALCIDDVVYCATFQNHGVSESLYQTLGNGLRLGINPNWNSCFMITLTNAAVPVQKTVIVKWAALYEGTYTADTLPPYVYKGYAAELAECQRYYQRFVYGANVTIPFYAFAQSSALGIICLDAGQQMRANASFKITGGTPSFFNGQTVVAASGWTLYTVDNKRIYVLRGTSALTIGQSINAVGGSGGTTIELSAEL